MAQVFIIKDYLYSLRLYNSFVGVSRLVIFVSLISNFNVGDIATAVAYDPVCLVVVSNIN